ncbi:MAG: dethiobiotin synthase [Cognatishimia sp.]
MNKVVVTGTDTGIGKTIFSAGLTRALRASYWKPVQAGLAEETDTQIVARLSLQPTLPESLRLDRPASPHIAAEAQGLQIDPNALTRPNVEGPLVIEGAGGLMVPLNRKTLFLDVFAAWNIPVILCARTQLGTINHSLLSLQALRAAGCSVVGIAFIGDPEPDAEDSITGFGDVTHLGRLPRLDPLTPASLHAAFAEIDVQSIQRAMS